MIYRFYCQKCNKIRPRSIDMDKYDELKYSQVCEACGSRMIRHLEWNGTATGSGQGWFGKSDGSKTI